MGYILAKLQAPSSILSRLSMILSKILQDPLCDEQVHGCLCEKIESPLNTQNVSAKETPPINPQVKSKLLKGLVRNNNRDAWELQ